MSIINPTRNPTRESARERPLAPQLGPVARAVGGQVRDAVATLASDGFHAVQLDGTLAGIRPRDLDNRARKDLLAMLARHEVRAVGLDLFIPRKHFHEAEHMDRAMGAALAAIELAADLGRLTVSLALPVSKMNDEAKATLVEAADGRSVQLAVHAEDQLDALLSWVDEVDLPALSIGLDPVSLLTRGLDPAEQTHRLSQRLAAARLGDYLAENDEGVGERCEIGRGDLDMLAYRIAVDLTQIASVTIDLRSLARPMRAAGQAVEAWRRAGPIT